MQPVTFLEALQFAQSRKVVLPDEFYALDLKTRQLATTVSFLSSIEQIKSVIHSVNKAIANGTTFEQFKKDVADSGIKLSEPYLDLVFRQNVQTAYSHGRWQQQQRNKDKKPYLMYSAIDDVRVRPTHLALNGVIRHIDDEFWLKYYPSWAFRCRCTTIALSEKQAEKRGGVTPDDKLPESGESDFTTSPMTWGEMSEFTRQKIANSGIDPRLLDDGLQAVEAQWTASKKLTSLLAPMDDKSRDLFNTIADIVIPLDPNIRPSAIKVFVDYVQGNDRALSAYLNQASVSKADDVLRSWVAKDMAAIQAVAVSTTATVTGSGTIAQAASLQVGQTVTLDSPMLLANTGGEIVFQLENAQGVGIDLAKLNAGKGVLLPIGASFEVKAIDTVKGQLVYRLQIVDKAKKSALSLDEQNAVIDDWMPNATQQGYTQKLLNDVDIQAKAKEYGLSLPEQVALRHYTGAGYDVLNEYFYRNLANNPLLDNVAVLLNQALDKLPDFKGGVVRRTKLPDAVLAQHQIGSIITYEAFTSTTNGAKDIFEGKPHRIVIKSKTGKDINWISNYSSGDDAEYEVLFGRPKRFKVENRRILPDGTVEIELEEIDA